MIFQNKDGEDILRVFVYGTLKVGGRLSGPVEGSRISSKEAKADGSMFSVNGAYPAVLFDGKKSIVGEIHEYRDAKAVLQTMDRIEGFSGTVKAKGAGNLYNRIEVEVDAGGEKVKCSTYEFNCDTDNLKHIANGVWEI
jgi:gamma-glutamylcyclotransferase (GGCT)/AIG2-like uncharacterized protein YtfP